MSERATQVVASKNLSHDSAQLAVSAVWSFDDLVIAKHVNTSSIVFSVFKAIEFILISRDTADARDGVVSTDHSQVHNPTDRIAGMNHAELPRGMTGKVT